MELDVGQVGGEMRAERELTQVVAQHGGPHPRADAQAEQHRQGQARIMAQAEHRQPHLVPAQSDPAERDLERLPQRGHQ
jgi:hypothetical protein